MPLTFKASSTKDIAGVPPGSYAAVCDMIVDLGLQPGSGAFPDREQVYIRFEIPSERVAYQKKNGQKVSGPAVIGSFFTQSMHEKSSLRKTLQAWLGKTFTDKEAESFDVSTILGKACLLTVVENQKGDKTYSNIASISPLPKGMQAPVAEMVPLLYTADDSAAYSALPEWLKRKVDGQLAKEIKEQPQTQLDHSSGHEPVEISDDDKITDDDIPF